MIAVWSSICVVVLGAGAIPDGQFDACLAAICRVGPQGEGHEQAMDAWSKLAACDAGKLVAMLTALDGANPLAANWIRTAVDAVAERTLARSAQLPAAELEQLVLDRRHGPRPRALAFEWLLRVDASAGERLLGGMLDDPCLALRRQAVERLADQAQKLVDQGDKQQASRRYEQALGAARDLDQVRTLAERLRKLGVEIDLRHKLGYVVDWHVIGPFDNVGEKGFDAVYPPEQEWNLSASYAGKHGSVRWQQASGGGDFAVVDLNKSLGTEKGVVGYAAVEFASARAQEVEFRLSSANAVKLWLNGRAIDQHPVYHSGVQPDQYVSRGELRPGQNRILVKVCQNEQTQEWAKVWQFQLRICDPLGAAVHPER